jgi:hypothetical protein
MYRISYILKNSRGSINNGTQMVRDIVAMLDQVIKFKNLKIVGKVREKSSEEEVFRQVLAKIRHVANVVVNGANLRTICAPDDELKATQRKILSRLDGIPSHRSAHGFVRDRDSMTCASAHTSLCLWR